MAKLVFDEVEFTRAEDQINALVLSQQQKQNIKNLIVQAVNEKVNMSAETPNYILKQEYLRGQLDILQGLLDASEEAENEMKKLQGLAPETFDT